MDVGEALYREKSPEPGKYFNAVEMTEKDQAQLAKGMGIRKPFTALQAP